MDKLLRSGLAKRLAYAPGPEVFAKLWAEDRERESPGGDGLVVFGGELVFPEACALGLAFVLFRHATRAKRSDN